MTKSKVVKIAIDDGSSQIKVVTADKSFSFPSIATENPAFDDNYNVLPESYEVLGQKISVISGDKTIPTNNNAYQVSKVNRVLINEAIRRAGVTGGSVDIAVTLPIKRFFGADGLPDENLIQRKKLNVLGSIKALDGRELPVIRDIKVLPECAAGFKYCRETYHLKGFSLCIDIGGFTTDIAIFNEGSLVDVKTIKNGSIQCVEQLAKILGSMVGEDAVSFTIANDVLLDGRFMGESVEEECRELIKDIVNTAIEEAQTLSSLKSCTQVVWIGGGANFVKKYCDLSNAYIPNEPEMANALGLLMAMGE